MIDRDWDPGAQRILKIKGRLNGVGISRRICGDLRNRTFVTVCKETLWKLVWDGDTIGIHQKWLLSRSSEWMWNPKDQTQELRGRSFVILKTRSLLSVIESINITIRYVCDKRKI